MQSYHPFIHNFIQIKSHEISNISKIQTFQNITKWKKSPNKRFKKVYIIQTNLWITGWRIWILIIRVPTQRQTQISEQMCKNKHQLTFYFFSRYRATFAQPVEYTILEKMHKKKVTWLVRWQMTH